ncbi:MAG: FeoB-associated Cys-rich membrane protein [Oscillospiraceae bacterium]|nr:FeoB-associated Cys-rich membrane protein [Oscillospiraceae bacterium]
MTDFFITYFWGNIGTFAAALILAAVVAMIIIRLYKNRKSGSCGCGGCANSDLCRGKSISKAKK